MPILGNRLLKRLSVSYLLRDEFITAAGSPLASPRTAEPGPGTLTLTQTDGQYSISSDKLQIPAQSTPIFGDQGFYAGGLARVVGRVVTTKLNLSTINQSTFGWNRAQNLNFTSGTNTAHCFYLEGANSLKLLDNASAGPLIANQFATATDYQLAAVLRSTGALYFIKGGAFTNWTLLWVGLTDSTATVYPVMSNSASVGTMDYIRAFDLGAPFTTDFGLTTLNQASVVSGNSYTGSADGLYHLTITADNPLLGTSAIGTELRYRVQDASNYWTAYLQEDGTLKVDSVASGVATNRLSVASVITNGATITLCVITNGSKHNVYTQASSGGWTKRGSEINVSHMDTQTTMQPQIGTNWSASNLRSWNRTSIAYNALN